MELILFVQYDAEAYSANSVSCFRSSDETSIQRISLSQLRKNMIYLDAWAPQSPTRPRPPSCTRDQKKAF